MNSAKTIDLRSDTVTVPTREMRRAMTDAIVGDDVYAEDPTVKTLQAIAAGILGMEDSLFVPTGTMGNQIAVNIHTDPGDEVIMEKHCHIYDYEMASMTAISGVMPRVVDGEKGIMFPDQVKEAFRPDVYYVAPTGLICLENTHNMAGGKVYPRDVIDEILDIAKNAGVPVHLDGARIFNAAAACSRPVKELVRGFDSVMFCLSKGLAAPVGSLLAGSRAFIEKARVVRKRMGGGMRQAGVLAAPGLIALERMTGRLREDHENAEKLAEGLGKIPGFRTDPGEVETNIVMAEITDGGLGCADIIGRLKERRILAGPRSEKELRFVTHKDVSAGDIEDALDRMQDLF